MKHVLSKNSPAGFWLTPFLTQHISIALETPGWWSVHPIAPLIWHYHNFMFLCLWVNFQFLSALKSHIAVSTKPHLGSHLKHTKQPLKTQCNWSLQHCLPYSFGPWYKKKLLIICYVICTQTKVSLLRWLISVNISLNRDLVISSIGRTYLYCFNDIVTG